ncbi:MAG: TraR/DksA C4-type zinc finger protein [Candidatus Paceibacterota bacterium]
MPLNKEQIKKLEIEERLIEEKEKIEKNIEALKGNLDFGDDVDGGDEEINETEEMSNFLSIREKLETRIDDIENALDKIKAGEFGLCEACGKRIAIEVLKVDPESRLCKDCKKKINRG